MSGVCRQKEEFFKTPSLTFAPQLPSPGPLVPLCPHLEDSSPGQGLAGTAPFVPCDLDTTRENLHPGSASPSQKSHGWTPQTGAPLSASPLAAQSLQVIRVPLSGTAAGKQGGCPHRHLGHQELNCNLSLASRNTTLFSPGLSFIYLRRRSDRRLAPPRGNPLGWKINKVLGTFT